MQDLKIALAMIIDFRESLERLEAKISNAIELMRLENAVSRGITDKAVDPFTHKVWGGRGWKCVGSLTGTQTLATEATAMEYDLDAASRGIQGRREICPLCHHSDQHAKECILSGKEHVRRGRETDGSDIDWTATLALNGLGNARSDQTGG
jgi:hypothetical protein